MLKVNNLSFSYGKQKILQNVSININKGEIVGLIGDNGAGKSTLMKLMCGLRAPDTGNIESKYKRIGALIEEPAIYSSSTVEENIEFFRVLYKQSKEKANEIIEVTGISSYMDKKVYKLSVGMKRRLGVAIALLSSEEMLLLDEPTNGLDPTGIRDILGLIKNLSEKKGTTFLISSHIFQNLESICDTYYKIADTKIENIYDNNRVFGYIITCDDMKIDDVIKLLDRFNCEYKVENKKIYIKQYKLTEALFEEFKHYNINIEKRKLSEVYYG